MKGKTCAVADGSTSTPCFPARRITASRTACATDDLAASAGSSGLTGWRVGWALAPRDLALKVSNAHTALTYARRRLQKGVAEVLKQRTAPSGVPATFHRNAEMLAAALTARGLDVFPPEGGYACANCREPAMAFVERADETGVVCTLPMAYATRPRRTEVRFRSQSAAPIDPAACKRSRPARSSIVVTLYGG